MSGVSPGQAKAPHESTQVVLPSERHRDFLRLLDANARVGTAGYREAWGLQTTYAKRLGCSVRTLQRVVADLREPGRDPRHLKVPPVGLRLGLIKIIPTHTTGQDGAHRLGADRYVLLFAAGAAAGMTSQSATRIRALTSGDAESVSLHSEGKASDHSHTVGKELAEVGTGTEQLAPVMRMSDYPPTGRSAAAPDGEPLVPIRRCNGCGELCDPGQSWHIGCAPSTGTVMRESRLRATLERAFGAGITVEIHDRIHLPTRHPPDGWTWIWEAKRTGRCVRCHKWAHTNGPDDQAWHPFCWAIPDVPVLKVDPPPRRRHPR